MRKQEEQFGGAFPSEDEFQRIYEECIEHEPQGVCPIIVFFV